MSSWKPLVVLSVVAVLLTGCCCCPISLPFGNAEFTAGDFPNVPIYPGASQTSESNIMINAMVAGFDLLAEESEWKHYVTTDSEEQVLDWYSRTMPDYGWAGIALDSTGTDVGISVGALAFVNMSEPNRPLYIVTLPDPDTGQTHIIVGRILLPVEVEGGQ